MQKDPPDLRVGEASRWLGVTTQTIRNWIREGKIEATRTFGGHFRIKESEIHRIIRAPLEIDAYYVCIVCKHQLNRHVNEGDSWRCHDIGCDMCQCECTLDKQHGDYDILFYDLRSRWLDSIKEFNKDLPEDLKAKVIECPECHGGGQLKRKFENGGSMMYACPDCRGIGKLMVNDR
jgi:putative resolvase